MKTTVVGVSDTPVDRLRAVPAKKRRPQEADIGITVRRLGQTYDESMPLYWLGNNAFLSMLFTGFSATLPEGEAQFIHSVRLFQDKVTDPLLRAQIRAFIGQEGHHSREHEALNNAFIQRGLRLDKIEKQIRDMNAWMQKHYSAEKQLAFTVCGEHLTALLSVLLLDKDPWFMKNMDEPLRTTWAWHAIEETEHKAVAFDVYDQLVGDRKLLKSCMVQLTFLFSILSTYHALTLLPRKEWLNFKMWRESFTFLRRMVKLLREDYMDFYKPDYHPWQHDDGPAVERAKQQYVAAG